MKSQQKGHGNSCKRFVTRDVTLRVTAAESRVGGRVCRLDHSISLCKTIFECATALNHFKRFELLEVVLKPSVATYGFALTLLSSHGICLQSREAYHISMEHKVHIYIYIYICFF